MSPTRRLSTSFSVRKEAKELKRRKQSIESTPSDNTPTALDLHPSADGSNDFYCWICHAEGEVICCDVCPRVFHEKCMPRVKRINQEHSEFFCPECVRVQDAENTATRMPSMRNVSSSGIHLYKYTYMTHLMIH
jgi:hypothetical protein